MGSLIFLLNPILYIIYKRINLKVYKRNEYLLIIAFSLINLYIPYNAGDSVHYAYKFYQLREFEPILAYQNYLPLEEPLYYNVLYLFSTVGLPYSFFVFFISFIIYLLIFDIIKKYNQHNKKIFSILILMFYPLMIGLTLRFPLAIFLNLNGILNFKKNKKVCIFFILAMYIHKMSVILLIVYFLSSLLHNLFKRIDYRIVVFFIILFSNLFYMFIENLYFMNTSSQFFRKLYNYKVIYKYGYLNLFETKLSFGVIFYLLTFFPAFIFLLVNRKLKKDRIFYFLITLGTIMLSLVQNYMIVQRFTFVFNVFFVVYLLNFKKIKSIFLNIYYFFAYLYSFFNILVILYYSTYLYMVKYKNVPIIFQPSVFLIMGIKNGYNEKIEQITKEFIQNNKISRDLHVNLEEYYKD